MSAAPIVANRYVPAALMALLVLLGWSHWPTLRELIEFWQNEADYSVGALVPFVTAWMIWSQPASFWREARFAPWALAALLGAQLLRLAALYYDYASLERLALVASIASVMWLALGNACTRRIVWPIAFLVLMVPLPVSLHNTISVWLQDLATGSAVFLLELAGYWVRREGNVMLLDNEMRVAVIEACSGLRMLTAFVVVAAAMALIAKRPGWQRLTLLAAALPIALACNSLRLIATVVAMHAFRNDFAEVFLHDFAGVAMMPIAVGLLLALLRLLGWLSDEPRRAPAAAKSPEAVRVA